MEFGKILLIAAFFFILTSPSVAALEKEITIWVEADIGINVSVSCGGNNPSVLQTVVGEPEACLLTVKNTGNVNDVIRLVSRLEPEDKRGWIDYHFECPGTIGECSLEYSYESALPRGGIIWPEVRNIRLTPQIKSTNLYVEAVPYRTFDNFKLNIRGYSLTNRTVEHLANITVKGKSKKDQYGPFVASGLQNGYLLMLFLLSGLVFYVTKFG